MKQVLFALSLFFYVAVYAQDFPGKSIEMLEGKELRVMELPEDRQDRGYPNFFSDSGLRNGYKKKIVGYTKYSALVGKVFKVKSYKPINSVMYAIELENKETGTLYYRYTQSNDYDYFFEVVGGLVYPEGFFCDRIIIEEGGWNYNYTDKVTPRKFTPQIDNVKASYSKFVTNKYVFSVKLIKKNDRKESGLKGLTLVLENGKEVNFPEEPIKVDPDDLAYEYSAEVHPNDEQFNMLMNSKIVLIKLASHEKPFPKGSLFMSLLQCLIK